jgi:hypothetical protein
MRRLVFGLLLLASPALAQDVWLNYSFSERPVPKWQNGYLLAYQTYREPSALFAFDRSGQMVLNKRIEIPGSGEIIIRDTAASIDGRFAITGSGTATGRFIASLTPSGAMAWIVKSTDFAAERIGFAPDGTLWAFGHVFGPSIRKPEDVPDHPTLRQYDSEGHLARSVLPKSSFALTTWKQPDMRAYMVPTRDRIGIYSDSAREWVEVSFDGEVLGRWKGMELPEYDFATGAALLPNGHVYVSVQYHTSPRTEVLLQVFKLDKQSGRWSIVDQNPDTHDILGVDGDQVVMWGPRRSLRWMRLD